jgi:nucleoside 2-deoxyribosyltransferase
MPASIAEQKASGFRFHCLQCGDFGITAEADLMLKHSAIDPSRVGAVSGYIRRNRGLTITSKNLDALRQIKIPPAAEKAMDLLAAFAAQYPQPGSPFPDPVPPVSLTLKKLSSHSAQTTYPDGIVPAYASFLSWIGISSANNVQELNWLIHQFLAIRGLVEFTKKMEIVEGKAYPQLILTPAGWAEVERLKQVNAESAVGFVAMSFQPEFAELYDRGIMPGIIAAGYQPLRIDRTEHNNRIDDEIIAAIKRSRFLVADFTTQRGGIYFEAGYALGLGLRVIWLVRKDQLKDVHFDNRQYNFIRWQAGEWEALQRALKNRIEATIGIGPATGSLSRRLAD